MKKVIVASTLLITSLALIFASPSKYEPTYYKSEHTKVVEVYNVDKDTNDMLKFVEKDDVKNVYVLPFTDVEPETTPPETNPSDDDKPSEPDDEEEIVEEVPIQTVESNLTENNTKNNSIGILFFIAMLSLFTSFIIIVTHLFKRNKQK